MLDCISLYIIKQIVGITIYNVWKSAPQICLAYFKSGIDNISPEVYRLNKTLLGVNNFRNSFQIQERHKILDCKIGIHCHLFLVSCWVIATTYKNLLSLNNKICMQTQVNEVLLVHVSLIKTETLRI